MIHNTIRNGNFTSSEIVALLSLAKDQKSFGKPALTYIEECNFERRLGRSLNDESNARPLTWGKLLEIRAFELLGLEYVLSSTETDRHPTIECWAGSKDGMKHNTIIDIKAPLTLKSFCQLVDPIYSGLSGFEAMSAIREKHKDGEKFYWQLVSNSIINNTEFAELIIYMPYKSELDDIRLLAGSVDADQLSKHYWISMATEDDLPYLIDGGYYNNLNVIQFQVPIADKKLLTEKVLEASKMLIKSNSTSIKTDLKSIPLLKIL